MNEDQNTPSIPTKKKSSAAWTVAIAVVLIVVLGWFAYKSESGRNNTENTSGASTTTINGVTVTGDNGSQISVEQVPIGADAGPAPDINRKINFPDGYPDDAKAIMLAKITDIKTRLSKNPYDVDAWNDLGLTWNTLGDYEGARLAWEYDVKLSASNSVLFGNLGFLYGYRLKNNALAEADFKKAISLSPTELYLYGQFFEFYRDVEKDYDKARALAKDGRAATGNNAYFDQLLLSLK